MGGGESTPFYFFCQLEDGRFWRSGQARSRRKATLLPEHDTKYGYYQFTFQLTFAIGQKACRTKDGPATITVEPRLTSFTRNRADVGFGDIDRGLVRRMPSLNQRPKESQRKVRLGAQSGRRHNRASAKTGCFFLASCSERRAIHVLPERRRPVSIRVDRRRRNRAAFLDAECRPGAIDRNP